MHDDLQRKRVSAAIHQLGETASHDDLSDEDLDAAIAAALTVPGVGEELKRRASQLAQSGTDDAEPESA